MVDSLITLPLKVSESYKPSKLGRISFFWEGSIAAKNLPFLNF